MPSPQPRDITAIVLAGGRGSRLGGQDKGWLEVDGRPLIEQVLAAMRPQVAGVVVSANRNRARYAALGVPVVADRESDHAGPLAGIAAALARVPTPWAVVVPCDGPCPPPDLVARLARALDQQGGEVAVAHDGRRLQPLHLLLPRRLQADVAAWLASGRRAVLGWLEGRRVAVADCADVAGAFLNINRPEDLGRLTRCASPLPVLGFCGWSGSGKTTLLQGLIAALAGRGLRLAVIKHSHHRFDIDHPGKDSYVLRHAGARQTVVASARRIAWIEERDAAQGADPRLRDALTALQPAGLDLVLVEGFKHERLPKVEVWRAALGRPPLWPDDPDVCAVASDAPRPTGARPVWLDLNDVAAVRDFVLDWWRRQAP